MTCRLQLAPRGHSLPPGLPYTRDHPSAGGPPGLFIKKENNICTREVLEHGRRRKGTKDSCLSREQENGRRAEGPGHPPTATACRAADSQPLLRERGVRHRACTRPAHEHAQIPAAVQARGPCSVSGSVCHVQVQAGRTSPDLSLACVKRAVSTSSARVSGVIAAHVAFF